MSHPSPDSYEAALWWFECGRCGFRQPEPRSFRRTQTAIGSHYAWHDFSRHTQDQLDEMRAKYHEWRSIYDARVARELGVPND